MPWLWIGTICATILVLIQILAIGPILYRLINWRFGRYLSLHFEGRGFFTPLLHFHARDLTFMIHAGPGIDRVFFSCKRLTFRLDPFFLLIGRLRLVNLNFDEPYLEYFNRVDSYRKNRWLPRRHRVELKSGSIRGGQIYVKDETVNPIYRIVLKDIDLDNFDMDVGTPIDILFRAERGEAQIASGRIEIGQSGGEGYIRLWGMPWSEIISMEDVPLPLMRSRISLVAHHSGGSEGRHAHGQVGFSGKGVEKVLMHKGDTDRFSVNFRFDIDWEDYRITLDLGLQKLIGKILHNAETNWISGGIMMGGRGVFAIVRKQEDESETA